MINMDYDSIAKEACRMAEIAKHVPIPDDQLEIYGDDDEKKAYEEQRSKLQKSIDLHSEHFEQTRAAWAIIRELRAEALYWRQKFNEAQAELTKGSKP
jgi:multidrug resistance efflux pump